MNRLWVLAVALLEYIGGERQSTSDIIGGSLAAPGSYPWLTNRNMKCGGALIHRRWLVTAAHCTYQHGDTVVFHRFNLNLPSEPNGEEAHVAKHVRHPLFQPNSPTEEHDLALVMLDELAAHTTLARLIAPSEDSIIFPGAKFTVAGWGALKEKGKSFPFLTQVEVPIVSPQVCADNEHYGYINKQVYPTNLCAGYDEGGKDACAGDSGSPLFTQIDGVGVVVGVVSWGIGCGRAFRPGVYTAVGPYRDWINAELAKEGDTLDAPPSCEGLCGKAAEGCWCDGGCSLRNDCCQDFQAACRSPGHPDSGTQFTSSAQTSVVGSCLGACGQAFDGCSCDDSCLQQNNCCGDYSLRCQLTNNPKVPPAPLATSQPTGQPAPASLPSSSPQEARGTCEGLCGSFSLQEGGRCWCDLSCLQSGDCCKDRSLHCPTETSRPTPEPTFWPTPVPTARATAQPTARPTSSDHSCEGRCGDHTGSCYCDSTCELQGDCCPDVVDKCGVLVDLFSTSQPKPAASSGKSKQSKQSKQFKPGKGKQPTPTPTPPPTVASFLSCEGQCGLFTGDCYCDSTCELEGDCCADVLSVCGMSSLLPAAAQSTAPEPYLLSSRSDSEASRSGSCVGQCGQLGGACHCDEACFLTGDCCFDALQVCGGPAWARIEDRSWSDSTPVPLPAPPAPEDSCAGQCGGVSPGRTCFCDAVICRLQGDCCEDMIASCQS